MKKTFIILIAVILLLLIGYSAWGRDVYYNLRDSAYWKELSSRISVSAIEEVTLDYRVVLEGEELKTFILDLGASGYYKSNWRQQGPTGPIIEIKFRDGSTEHFQYWGKGIYETSYKNGQFLIRNLNLDTILEKYHINDWY